MSFGILGLCFCDNAKLRKQPATVANCLKIIDFPDCNDPMYENCDCIKFCNVTLT